VNNGFRNCSSLMCRFLGCKVSATLKYFSLMVWYLSAGRIKMLNSLDNLKQSIYLNISTPTYVILNNKNIQQVRDFCYGHLIFLSNSEDQVPLNFTLIVHSTNSLRTITVTPHKTTELLFLLSHLLQDLKSASV